jgi:hypothetical protein
MATLSTVTAGTSSDNADAEHHQDDQDLPFQFDNASQLPPSLKRFKFLAAKLATQHQISPPSAIDDAIRNQLNQYINELQHNSFLESPPSTKNANALVFWQNRQAQYGKLAEFALDVLASPASQAYVERIFSVCGLLTTGHRNRMQKSL